jgi:peptidoglycan/xylan/chitin deacetylase (PgdA/CDA1 family)
MAHRSMNAVTFMYHDIVAAGASERSGFAGQAADVYKLTAESFEQHLEAIAAAAPARPAVVTESSAGRATYITFDDGGRGSFLNAAPALEQRGWRGHFLIATDYINQPPFFSEDEICELHRRGHVIGSHSASHPLRMARCSRAELRNEWTSSIERLSGIIGAAVTVASVPGGMYSAAVAEEAGKAGIRYLFNSEPVTRVQKLGSCAVLGRFTVKRNTSPGHVRSLARGDRVARLRELAWWNFRKSAKAMGGEIYWRYRRDK